MNDELVTILDDQHDLGYDSVEPVEGFEGEASGVVALPEEHRREPATGRRRLVPRVYCNAGDPDLVPEDLRDVVEGYGWTVQAMGRDAETVTVVISRHGV